MVVGEDTEQLQASLTALGFRTLCEEVAGLEQTPVSGHPGVGWMVLVVSKAQESDIWDILSRARSRLRSGGWAIVGVEGIPRVETFDASRRDWVSQIEGTGFALAERLTLHPGGYHVILRRIGAGVVG